MAAKLAIGEIVGTHGRHGELRVRTYNPQSDTLFYVPQVWLGDQQQTLTPYEKVSARWHKKWVLLGLQGLESLEQAQACSGKQVWVEQTDLPELPADTHYWYELQGLEVYDNRYGFLGCLVGCEETPAHDIYIVEGPRGTVQIPAVAALVQHIDPETGYVQVSLPAGLIEL